MKRKKSGRDVTTPKLMFLNAATGWLLQVERSGRRRDGQIVFGPGGGYREEWWRLVRPADMSFTPAWYVENEAAGEVLTVLGLLGLDYRVGLRPIGEQVDRVQLWYLEHYPNTFYDPWTMPVLPTGIRLWCNPEPDLGLVLAPIRRRGRSARFPSFPIPLGASNDSQAGAEAHWFPTPVP